MWVSYGALMLTLKEEQSYRVASVIQRQSRSDFNRTQITFFRSINRQKPSLCSPMLLLVWMTLFAISKLKLLERCSWGLLRCTRHLQINLYSLRYIPSGSKCVWMLKIHIKNVWITKYQGICLKGRLHKYSFPVHCDSLWLLISIS